MKILEGNKLINAFMGRNPQDARSTMPELLQYHKSWEWLMTVVKKVTNELHDLRIQYNKNGLKNALIRGGITGYYNRLGDALISADIDAAWKEIVEIIEFCNKTKKES